MRYHKILIYMYNTLYTTNIATSQHNVLFVWEVYKNNQNTRPHSQFYNARHQSDFVLYHAIYSLSLWYVLLCQWFNPIYLLLTSLRIEYNCNCLPFSGLNIQIKGSIYFSWIGFQQPVSVQVTWGSLLLCTFST